MTALRRLLVPTLLVALAAIPAALAGPGRGGPGPGPGGHGPHHDDGFGPGHGPDGDFDRMGKMIRHMAARLDLTAGQRAEMEQLLEQRRATAETRHETGLAAHEALREAMQAETFDEAAVRAAAEEVASLRVEAMVDRARLHNELMQVLTPEQREEARAMHEEMQERRADRRQSRKDRRRAPRPGGWPDGS